MGTKNNPGRFDCYHKAEPDEPVFVLLARDPSAARLVYEWAWEREQAIEAGLAPESDREKVVEARECACAMDNWRLLNRPRVSPPALRVVKTEDIPVDTKIVRGPYVPPTPETERTAAAPIQSDPGDEDEIPARPVGAGRPKFTPGTWG